MVQEGYGRRTEETAGGSSKGWEVGEIGGKLRNDAQYFAIVKVLKGGRQGKRGGSQEDPTYLAPFVLTLNPTERS